MLNATRPIYIGATPWRNVYVNKRNPSAQITSPSGRQWGGAAKGERASKTWGPRKMTKRTQFPSVPAIISDCAAYKWRPPGYSRWRPKIGFALGFLGDRFASESHFPRTSCETASNPLPANPRQDTSPYRKRPITLWNSLAYRATVAQRCSPVNMLYRLLFVPMPSNSGQARFGAYQLHRQTPDRRCPSAKPGRTAVGIRSVAKKAGVYGPQAERAVQKAKKDLLAPVQPADVEPGEVHPRDQQDFATRLYGHQVAPQRPPISPKNREFYPFFKYCFNLTYPRGGDILDLYQGTGEGALFPKDRYVERQNYGYDHSS